MKYSANEIKVGFVVVISVVFLLVFILALSGSGLWKKTMTYTTEFSMSAGLEPGDVVRYGGMEVGSITRVYIAPDDPKKIEIVLQVKENTPVKTDSIAFINFIGLLGAYYIEISAGSDNASLLPPGSILLPGTSCSLAI